MLLTIFLYRTTLEKKRGGLLPDPNCFAAYKYLEKNSVLQVHIILYQLKYMLSRRTHKKEVSQTLKLNFRSLYSGLGTDYLWR